MSVKRICDRCGKDQTPVCRGIYSVSNSRGYSIGLFCSDCLAPARKSVDTINSRHGAYIVDGRYLSSPQGAPSSPEPYRELWMIQ